MRNMWDAASPANIPAGADFIAGYLTGTPGDVWKGHHMDVSIDQDGIGAPRYDANVIDVEPNAYRPADVPGWVKRCTAPRPTVYCDRSDYPDVRAVWSGDLWLSAPGISQPPDAHVIGIQNLFASNYDRSIIFDPYWPNKPPVKGSNPMIVQDQWKYCHKCKTLFYGPDESSSVCAAGGIHDGSESGNYVLLDATTASPAEASS